MRFADGFETLSFEEKGECVNVVVGDIENDERLCYPLTLREAQKVVDFLEKFIRNHLTGTEKPATM